jgi:hypothetical protein
MRKKLAINIRVLLFIVALPGMLVLVINLLSIIYNAGPSGVGLLDWVFPIVPLYFWYLAVSGKAPRFLGGDGNRR